MSRHTLSVLVEDASVVIARIAMQCARRGIRLKSIATHATDDLTLGRITLILDVRDLPIEQVTKQLSRLINVIDVVELNPGTGVFMQICAQPSTAVPGPSARMPTATPGFSPTSMEQASRTNRHEV
jgi:acetolactate synthase small subunit